ncbi:sugar-binding transcriptional regulator [Actinotalea sp. JY-7876]|uniref:sugar-binding transcriptional regulator n=1 Tax=Actinotalea sp. JY-7876 TaxID=2758442 RepID=UPI002105D71C|nr:sugar-binding transcriptional regulator [Actinotalea sp. JY-7876]
MNDDFAVMLRHSEDQLRLMTRVARMYHEQGMRQLEIAENLHISQPRVSRLLKRAVEVGIVRTTVSLPAGVHPDLEERVEKTFGVRQCIVVDVRPGEDVTRALGAAAADHLAATLLGGDTVGISSWSASLIAVADALDTFRTPVADTVVQLVGGLGAPRVQLQATRLISQFASRLGAEPRMLQTPGVLGTSQARASLMADASVADVVECWSRLTVALVGIGAIEPSDLAKQSGNTFPEEDRALLEAAGAVGDVCFRFYDARGEVVDANFHDRVIGISPDQLRAVPRRIGVAGGAAKLAAIRGALLGGWVNILVTDSVTAQNLLDTSP